MTRNQGTLIPIFAFLVRVLFSGNAIFQTPSRELQLPFFDCRAAACRGLADIPAPSPRQWLYAPSQGPAKQSVCVCPRRFFNKEEQGRNSRPPVFIMVQAVFRDYLPQLASINRTERHPQNFTPANIPATPSPRALAEPEEGQVTTGIMVTVLS